MPKVGNSLELEGPGKVPIVHPNLGVEVGPRPVDDVLNGLHLTHQVLGGLLEAGVAHLHMACSFSLLDRDDDKASCSN